MNAIVSKWRWIKGQLHTQGVEEFKLAKFLFKWYSSHQVSPSVSSSTDCCEVRLQVFTKRYLFSHDIVDSEGYNGFPRAISKLFQPRNHFTVRLFRVAITSVHFLQITGPFMCLDVVNAFFQQLLRLANTAVVFQRVIIGLTIIATLFCALSCLNQDIIVNLAIYKIVTAKPTKIVRTFVVGKSSLSQRGVA
jgi:hypothetical protein